MPGVVTAAPAAAAKDCDPNQKRIRPFVFLTSSDQTTSRLIYVFLHYDDMKAFIQPAREARGPEGPVR